MAVHIHGTCPADQSAVPASGASETSCRGVQPSVSALIQLALADAQLCHLSCPRHASIQNIQMFCEALVRHPAAHACQTCGSPAALLILRNLQHLSVQCCWLISRAIPLANAPLIFAAAMHTSAALTASC